MADAVGGDGLDVAVILFRSSSLSPTTGKQAVLKVDPRIHHSVWLSVGLVYSRSMFCFSLLLVLFFFLLDNTKKPLHCDRYIKSFLLSALSLIGSALTTSTGSLPTNDVPPR